MANLLHAGGAEMLLRGFESVEELREGEVQRLGELGSRINGNRLLAALDSPNVGTMQAALVGELFL